jgi:hypothetical protein
MKVRPAIGARRPPCRGKSGKGISELGVVARDGPIREANQDRRARRVCPKGANRPKSIRVNRTIDTRIFRPRLIDPVFACHGFVGASFA